MEQLQKNKTYTVDITGITSDGNGVGRIEGFAVFVPDTAPGDTAEIKLVKTNKSYGYGKAERLVTASKSRIAPDCPVFAPCGGCAFRHISYKAELDIKRQFVIDAFKRIGGIGCDVGEIIAAENADGYRNKAQYPLSMDKDGKIIAGFYAKRSHRVVATTHCALQPQIFTDIKDAILEFANIQRLTVYQEETGRGLLRHIYLRQGEATDQMMVCLVTTAFDIPHIQKLVALLNSRFPQIKSIVINRNKENTNVILGNDCMVISGADTIEDILCGVRVLISPLSFYQVNRRQAECLYNKAIDYAELTGSETLVDLYCGAGTIGLAAAGKVKSLIGVEIVKPAVENAIANAKRNGIDNARFICAEAGQAAQQLAEEGLKPDVIIVDPPRKGLEDSVISAMADMSPSRIVMVSCNPTTAARDCKALIEKGYIVEEICPVDMFPRTTHVECVVRLSRVEKG